MKKPGPGRLPGTLPMVPLVEMKGMSKSFNGVKALHNVDFQVRDKEIVGLLGANGAGKSTLIKILSGLHRPDSGRIRFRGRPIDLTSFSVKKARQLGIETVYQERSLGEKQPWWRNIFCGRTGRSWGRRPKKQPIIKRGGRSKPIETGPYIKRGGG